MYRSNPMYRFIFCSTVLEALTSLRSRATSVGTIVVATFLLLATVIITSPAPTSAQSACAAFVSGGAGSPARGELVGWVTVTETISVAPRGVGGSVSISFNVGWYRMDDGEVSPIRCDNYTLWLA